MRLAPVMPLLSLVGSSLTLTDLSSRKTFWSLSMVTTMCCSVSWLTERVLGMATSMPDCRTGAVSMKMSSRTNTTSTKGVMLISASAVWVRPRVENAMGLEGPPAGHTEIVAGHGDGRRGGLRRGVHGGVLDQVEELAAELVHARAELADAGGELVVADDRRDGDDQAGGGGDERLGEARGGGAPGGDLGGALRGERVAGHAAAAGLAVVLVVDLEEDGNQRAGLELLGDGGDLGEAAGLAEGA